MVSENIFWVGAEAVLYQAFKYLFMWAFYLVRCRTYLSIFEVLFFDGCQMSQIISTSLYYDWLICLNLREGRMYVMCCLIVRLETWFSGSATWN